MAAAWSVGVARGKVGPLGPAHSGMIRARGVLLRLCRWRDDWATWGAGGSASHAAVSARKAELREQNRRRKEEEEEVEEHLSAAGKSLTHLTPWHFPTNFIQKRLDDPKLTVRGWSLTVPTFYRERCCVLQHRPLLHKADHLNTGLQCSLSTGDSWDSYFRALEAFFKARRADYCCNYQSIHP